MCTLFIYRKKNTKWPVLIATNRDEFFKRKFFSPNKHWSSNIDIFAGKDTLKGGSWLGINKSHNHRFKNFKSNARIRKSLDYVQCA